MCSYIQYYGHVSYAIAAVLRIKINVEIKQKGERKRNIKKQQRIDDYEYDLLRLCTNN